MGWFGRKKTPKPDEAVRTAFVHSKNMHLKVAAPQGESWKVMEAGGGGALLAAFKCLSGEPPEALALDAMLYRADELPTLEQLRERDWKSHFLDKMFAEIDDLETREVEHRARSGGFVDEGFEVEVRGRLREPAMALVLVERHVPVQGRLLVISAAGAPERHEAEARLIDTWLSHATLGER
jgi:hypothetical protein